MASPAEMPWSSTNSMAAAVFFLGSKMAGQLLETGVRDLDDGDGIGALGRGGLGGGARQGGKERAFPRLGQADDTDLHVRFPSGD